MKIGDEYFDVHQLSPNQFQIHCRNKATLLVFSKDGEWFVSDNGSIMLKIPAELRKALRNLGGVEFTEQKFSYRIRNGRVSEALFYILPIVAKLSIPQ